MKLFARSRELEISVARDRIIIKKETMLDQARNQYSIRIAYSSFCPRIYAICFSERIVSFCNRQPEYGFRLTRLGIALSALPFNALTAAPIGVTTSLPSGRAVFARYSEPTRTPGSNMI